MRTSWMVALALISGMVAAACADRVPTGTETSAASTDDGQGALASVVVPPILVEELTARHEFTDDIAVQVRVRPVGRPTEVVNIKDASNTAVLRFTVQPGVRFPWHSHPGLVMVTITQGELVFVYANDCIERGYPAGTAFVDPGFGNVHYAFNPTGGETVLVATFLGVPATGPLTIPVDAATATALDAKCGVAQLASHSH